MRLPIRSSYWAGERLLAGEYPGSWDAQDATRRLRAFANQDVTLFVDLTHPADGLEPYESAARAPATRIAHPIVDMGTTTIPHMSRILDDIDAALEAGSHGVRPLLGRARSNGHGRRLLAGASRPRRGRPARADRAPAP